MNRTATTTRDTENRGPIQKETHTQKEREREREKKRERKREKEKQRHDIKYLRNRHKIMIKNNAFLLP